MITDTDLDRLRAIRSTGRPVLSLYLRVPVDPAELRELPVKARGLMAAAASRGGDQGGPGDPGAGRSGGQRWRAQDDRQARELLELHGRDWLGHTAAIFIADEAEVAESYPVPCQLPERAVLAERPHIRPLLVARQRCPVHYVVIADRLHAWLFRVSGDQVEVAAVIEAEDEIRSTGFGGWYGLDSHRINDRVIELASQHLHATVDLLKGRLGAGREPLVIGGHAETIAHLAGLLPAGLRDRVAGSFVVDPHSMTPATVRELAAPVIGDWVGMHEQSRAISIREAHGPHDPLTVSGLDRCLDAVNRHAVELLVVPVGGVIDGYVCERCGELGAAITSCPAGPAESRWVPDLLEEMVAKTIGEGGRTEALTDPPGAVAAQLRFPVLSGASGS